MDCKGKNLETVEVEMMDCFQIGDLLRSRGIRLKTEGPEPEVDDDLDERLGAETIDHNPGEEGEDDSWPRISEPDSSGQMDMPDLAQGGMEPERGGDVSSVIPGMSGPVGSAGTG